MADVDRMQTDEATLVRRDRVTTSNELFEFEAALRICRRQPTAAALPERTDLCAANR